MLISSYVRLLTWVVVGGTSRTRKGGDRTSLRPAEPVLDAMRLDPDGVPVATWEQVTWTPCAGLFLGGERRAL